MIARMRKMGILDVFGYVGGGFGLGRCGCAMDIRGGERGGWNVVKGLGNRGCGGYDLRRAGGNGGCNRGEAGIVVGELRH